MGQSPILSVLKPNSPKLGEEELTKNEKKIVLEELGCFAGGLSCVLPRPLIKAILDGLVSVCSCMPRFGFLAAVALQIFSSFKFFNC